MTASLPFGLGLIEGYYGRTWSAQDRLACIEFLGATGYRYYVYAPKGDACLRRDWSARWSREDETCFQAVTERCVASGVLPGVGLSPLGLVENPTAGQRRCLRDKVRYLEDLGIGLLCILFDDMPRGIDNLAELQCELVAEIHDVTRAKHLLMCPSYYSSDPVLERVFGARPEGYWESLGSGLPDAVGIFWTGEKVCSASYDAQSLQRIAGAFGRKPVLWDNYPVNDGARASRFLHIDAFHGRDHSLGQLTGAHFVNPMNQCWLSRIPLATLPRVYRDGAAYDPEKAFREAAMAACGPQLGALLAEDLERLQRRGLDEMPVAERVLLRARYEGESAPAARELVDWLDGGYTFDPACLTD